jgi:predicted RNA-binding protein YlxR (DUF448 family)
MMITEMNEMMPEMLQAFVAATFFLSVIKHNDEYMWVIDTRPLLRQVASADGNEVFWIKRQTNKASRGSWREANTKRMWNSRARRLLEKPPSYAPEAKPADCYEIKLEDISAASTLTEEEKRDLLDCGFRKADFGGSMWGLLARRVMEDYGVTPQVVPAKTQIHQPDPYTKNLFDRVKKARGRTSRHDEGYYEVIVENKSVSEVASRRNYKHRSFKTLVSEFKRDMERLRWQDDQGLNQLAQAAAS